MKSRAFLERALRHLPHSPEGDYTFVHWDHEDKPVAEGLGLLRLAPSIAPEQVIAKAMDLNHYVGHIPHVLESRIIPDARFDPPNFVRVYQRAGVPLLKDVQHETARVNAGQIDGFHCAYWNLLEEETSVLNPKRAARSQYHSGVWLLKPGVVAYAISTIPRREDLGLLKWKALKSGAVATAPRMVRMAMEAMIKWAQTSNFER